MSAVTLNHIKHHLKQIEVFIRNNQDDPAALKKSLLIVGNSQMDLYTGPLSIQQIDTEVTHLLKSQTHYERPFYLQWLHEQGGYQTMALSDSSVWVLREGEQEAKYVHIHPGRYSPHTLRVKASTLKTAIAALCIARSSSKIISLSMINDIRKDVLGLSPLRQILPDKGVGKLLLRFKPAFPALFDEGQ